jgi:YD repeat-containing protein
LTLTAGRPPRSTAHDDYRGNTTAYAYDAQGRLTTITDPAGLATTLAYGADGKLETVTDTAGRTTTYEHDALGRLVRVVFPDGSEIAYAHDPQNRVTAVTDQRGFTTSHDYGFAGQFTGSGFPDGASVAASISKDLGLADLGIGLGTEANPAPFGRPENQMAEVTDGNGNVTTFKLDEFGAPIEITDAIGRTMTLERDQDGLPTRITVPSATRSRSLVESASVLCATERLSCKTAANCSSPKRWRQRVSEERSKRGLCWKASSPQKY